LFAPFVIGRFCACLPYSGFTRPPVVAVAPSRSNPLLFWIRRDSIPAPGAGEQSKPGPACKCPRQPGSINRFATREINEVPSQINSRESGGVGSPPKSLTNSFTEDHGLRRMSSKLQSRTSGLPVVSSTSCSSASKEISR